MKSKFLKVLLIVSILALCLVAAAPYQATTPGTTEPTPLTLPAAVGVLLTAIVGFFVVNGLKSLTDALRKNKYFAWVPDLSGLSVNITTAIVTTIILFGNAILAALPPDLVSPVSVVITVIVVPILAYGVHYFVTGFQPAQPVG
jgi:hypothetical protein